MKHRIYLPAALTEGADYVLDGDRTHYLTRVLRLSQGATLTCFDGAGSAWQATLLSTAGKTASIRVGALVESTPPSAERLHLAQSLLKGAAMDVVIQKATELGATDLWLLDADRSNVALDRTRMDRKRDHWLRVIESAAAQCHQLYLPRLHGPMPLATCLAELGATIKLMLDPGAPPLPLSPPSGSLAVLVGPEGGWTDQERALALRAGVMPYGLGPLVLRAETAPLAVLAALRHARGWM